MKRLIKSAVLVIVPALISISAYAQANIEINLAVIATGTEYEGSHGPSALMTEEFLASEAGQSLMTRINSFGVNEYISDEIKQWKKSLESLTKSRQQYVGKTDEASREILKSLDENIAMYQEYINRYSSQSSGSGNAEALIEEARSHSAGGRLYYGAEYIDHGCWAVGIYKEYRTPNSKYGVINSAGEVVVPFIYNHLEAHPDVKMLTTIDCRNRKQGLIRYDGSLVLDCKYDIVNRGNSASFVIIDNNGNDSRWGVADLGGKIVIPQIYKEIEPFKYNLESGTYEFYVVTDAKTKLKAVFDRNFKQITGFIYEGWLNEQPYFIGVRPEGNNDVYDARSWQKLENGIPEEYWKHRFEEIEGK